MIFLASFSHEPEANCGSYHANLDEGDNKVRQVVSVLAHQEDEHEAVNYSHNEAYADCGF